MLRPPSYLRPKTRQHITTPKRGVGNHLVWRQAAEARRRTEDDGGAGERHPCVLRRPEAIARLWLCPGDVPKPPRNLCSLKNKLEREGWEELVGLPRRGPARPKQGNRGQGKAAAVGWQSLRRPKAWRRMTEAGGVMAGRGCRKERRGVARGGHGGRRPLERASPAAAVRPGVGAGPGKGVGAEVLMLETERGGRWWQATSESLSEVARGWRMLRSLGGRKHRSGRVQEAGSEVLVASGGRRQRSRRGWGRWRRWPCEERGRAERERTNGGGRGAVSLSGGRVGCPNVASIFRKHESLVFVRGRKAVGERR